MADHLAGPKTRPLICETIFGSTTTSSSFVRCPCVSVSPAALSVCRWLSTQRWCVAYNRICITSNGLRVSWLRCQRPHRRSSGGRFTSLSHRRHLPADTEPSSAGACCALHNHSVLSPRLPIAASVVCSSQKHDIIFGTVPEYGSGIGGSLDASMQTAV